MAFIKGSVVKEAVESTKSALEESEYHRLTSLLTEAGKDLVSNPISSSGWYLLDAYTNFLDVLVREKLGGNSDLLIEPTERVIEKQLKGVYSVFVKEDSPDFLIKNMSLVNSIYLKGVEIESSRIIEDRLRVKYTGFEKQHAVFEPILIGFYRKAAQIYGSQDITVEFTTRIAEGKGYAELLVTLKK
jgi:hypothetical protein